MEYFQIIKSAGFSGVRLPIRWSNHTQANSPFTNDENFYKRVEWAVQNALDNDEVLEGFVKRRTKGGLIVDILSIETFLPGSQIDVKPIRDYDIYVDKPLNVKIVKINYSNDNVVVSHKIIQTKEEKNG